MDDGSNWVYLPDTFPPAMVLPVSFPWEEGGEMSTPDKSHSLWKLREERTDVAGRVWREGSFTSPLLQLRTPDSIRAPDFVWSTGEIVE